MTLVENPRRAFDPFAPPMIDDGGFAPVEDVDDSIRALLNGEQDVVVDYADMTVKELRGYVAAFQIAVPKGTKKADIVALILEAEAKAAAEADTDDTDPEEGDSDAVSK